VWLYSLVNDNIEHIPVQLHHNDRLCCIDCIKCKAVDSLKKSTKVMAAAAEFVKKWCNSGKVFRAEQRKIAVIQFEINCLTQSGL
jgi:hypothetical protein